MTSCDKPLNELTENSNTLILETSVVELPHVCLISGSRENLRREVRVISRFSSLFRLLTEIAVIVIVAFGTITLFPRLGIWAALLMPLSAICASLIRNTFFYSPTNSSALKFSISKCEYLRGKRLSGLLVFVLLMFVFLAMHLFTENPLPFEFSLGTFLAFGFSSVLIGCISRPLLYVTSKTKKGHPKIRILRKKP